MGVAAYLSGDYRKAFRLFKPLAEQGYADVQYSVALMYAEGQGVPENDAQAVHWYRKAAEQGTAVAQFNLGLQYAAGDGVPRDLVQTYAWWSVAATQGDEDAREYKGIVEGEMTPDQIAKGRDPAHEQKRAQRQTVSAAVELFIERHVRRNNRPSTARETIRKFERYILPAWDARPIASIERRDVAELIQQIADGGAPVMAQTCRWPD